MLAETIQYLYPGIDLRNECLLQDDGAGPYIKAWRRAEKQPTIDELKAAEPAALAALAVEDAKRVESTTARDDAKRALAALDTIIAGIDAATLAQAKAAIKQLAQIQKHLILATLGR